MIRMARPTSANVVPARRHVKARSKACCCYMKMPGGNCYVKRSSVYGDLHDEPEGAASPRAAESGLSGRITTRPLGRGATNEPPQAPRLKRRFEAAGAAGLTHRSRDGLPLALYGDRLNLLVRNDGHWSLDEQLAGRQAPTHLGT